MNHEGRRGEREEVGERERETKSAAGNCHEHVIEEQFNHKTNNEAVGRDRHSDSDSYKRLLDCLSQLLPADGRTTE